MKRYGSRMFGAVALAAAAFGMSAPVSAQQATEAWQPNEDDFLLLQVQVGKYRMSDNVRGYRTDAGICLDLADVIQSLDLPIRLDKKSRRATGWLFAEDQRFTLDRAAGTVQNMNTGTAPLTNEIYDTPEGWCIDTTALSRWFGFTFEPDLFNASIRLESDQTLPFIEAMERESRGARLRPKRKAFDLSQYPHSETEYRVWRTPSVDAVLRAGFNDTSGQETQTLARLELYAAGELAGASYTARMATDNSLQPNSLRLRAYRYSPDGGMLGPLDATQVAAGDVETLSGQLTGLSAVGRGAFVSNRPLDRGTRFSTTTLRGTLPTGWDAELYRNGQLIAFQDDTEDGRYEFEEIELYYGRNDLEVVLYGPQGQIRRGLVDLPVGFNQIEPGQTYYWAGILEKDRDLIDLDHTGPPSQGWRWGTGIERGLDQRTSFALGSQSFMLGGRRRTYLEGTLWRTLGPAQIELAGAHEWGAGGVVQANALGRWGDVNLGASATFVRGDFASEFIGPQLDYRFGLRADSSLKLGEMVLPIQAAIGQAVLRDGQKVSEWLIATAVSTGRINIGAELERKSRHDADTGLARTDTRLQLLANSRMFGLRLRGSAGFDFDDDGSGFEYARVSAERDLDEFSEIRAEAEYQAVNDSARFRLGYARRFDKFALRADATYGSRGAVGANLALSFSFGPDPLDGGIRFDEDKLARTGQAAVTVFRDDNGDGIRSSDEPLLPDVGVEAGFRVTDAVTDANGRAVVDNLKPFKPVVVGIDLASLGDPFLAPASKGIVVVPRPGIASVVELAITPSGEIEGGLVSVSGVSLNGVVLELVDPRGAVIATTVSEYDGFFYFDRVPYGRYRIRVEAEIARKLDLRETIPGEVHLKRGNDLVRLGVLRLENGATTIVRAD